MSNEIYQEIFAKSFSSKATFIKLNDHSEISYEDFFKAASQLSNSLNKLGVKAGDRVAAQISKSPEALMLYVASILSGAVFLPLNTAYTRDEIGFFIDDSEPTIFVCDEENIAEYKSEITNTMLMSLIGDSNSLMALATNESSSCTIVERGPDDLAAMLYTSGTTGRSKGAMLTHENLVSNAKDLAKLWQFSPKDVLLHALPIFHTHGLFVATNVCLTSGCSMIFLPSFSVDELIEFLPQSSSLMGVPTFYTRLLADRRFNKDLVKNMRLFISGSAPLLAETHTLFERRVGHKILERYGMTETNMNASNPYEGERRAGTVGLALPSVDIRIRDIETKKIVDSTNIGVIEVKGKNVFKGYWKMPEKTAEEFTTDGFFITGDIGVISEDGYLSIVGRDKDLIISGGFNIYPKEIETVIDEIDGVQESAVIGVADADFGEAVLAIVVLEKSSSTDLTEDNVMLIVKEKLARFKHPRKIFFVEELPRNTMAKVQKNVLRDQYQKALVE